MICMFQRTARILFAIGLCPSLAVNVTIAAEGYEARGVLSCKFFRPTGEVAANQEFPFTAAVTGSSWKIEVDLKILGEGKIEKSISDGKNVAVMFVDPSSEDLPIPTVFHTNGFPNSAYYLDIPWFALASGPFFETSGLVPAPWVRSRWDVLAHAVVSQVTVSHSRPHLPAQADFMTDKMRANSAWKNNMLTIENIPEKVRRERQMISRALPGNLLVARYEALHWTNIDKHFSIPIEFLLIAYQAGSANPKILTTNRVAAQFSGKVTKIVTLHNAIVWPDSDVPIAISDRRFRDEKHGIYCIQYLATNWPTNANSAHLHEIFKQKIQKTPAVSYSRLKEYAMLTFLGILVLLPAIAWWLWHRKTATQNSKHQYGV